MDGNKAPISLLVQAPRIPQTVLYHQAYRWFGNGGSIRETTEWSLAMGSTGSQVSTSYTKSLALSQYSPVLAAVPCYMRRNWVVGGFWNVAI